MLYVTTRNNRDAYTAQRVLRENRGPDGGLYVPFREPVFSREEIDALKGKSFHQCVAEVLNRLFNTKLTPAGYIQKQDMAFTIALCQQLLEGEGAVRIHGGGFAGTAVAFVPNDRFDRFKTCVERVLGEGHCHKLTIR